QKKLLEGFWKTDRFRYRSNLEKLTLQLRYRSRPEHLQGAPWYVTIDSTWLSYRGVLKNVGLPLPAPNTGPKSFPGTDYFAELTQYLSKTLMGFAVVDIPYQVAINFKYSLGDSLREKLSALGNFLETTYLPKR